MVRPDLGLQSRREKGDPGGDSCSVGRGVLRSAASRSVPNSAEVGLSLLFVNLHV